jgi:hypothetical protein
MAGTAPPQYQTYKNQVQLGPGQQLGFQTGRGYYARGLAQAAAADPYSQLTGYQPLTSAQIQQQAQSEISPIISAITGQANTQAANEGAQIQALTQEYANELGQMNIAAPYQAAAPQQAAVDAALQQSLTGAGSSQAASLANKLAGLQGSSGAGAVGQAGGQLASQGAASGVTQLAGGSAALSNLIANAAAGGEFGAKLPAIAKLSGLQALGQNAGQLQQTTNNAVSQAESQVPSIIQDLTANNETGLSNAVSAQQKKAALDFENAVKQAALGQGAARIGIEQQNANTTAARAASTAAAQQDASARGWASIGIRAKAAQAKAKADEKKLESGGFTPAQVQRFDGTALTLAQNVYQGFTDAKGVPHPALTYQQAVLEGRKEGLPVSIIVKALDQFYKPGERGRPKAPLQISEKAYKTPPTQQTTQSLKSLGGLLGG